MEDTSPRIRSLLRQADRVSDAGKRGAAEKLYRQIIEEAPETAQAWVGLAGVINNRQEQEAAYQRAMELDPHYEAAKTGLSDLFTDNAEEVEADETAKDASILADAEPADETSSATVQKAVQEPLEVARNPFLTSPAGEIEDHSDHRHVVLESEEVLYCANHSGRQTHLRCNRCGKPICSSCAKPTPVGYRCPECIREQEEVFFTARPIDYVIAIIISLPLSLIAGVLATFLGFWAIFLAAIAGSLIGRVAFRAAGRRRGRWLPQLVGVVVVVGGILPAIPALLALMVGHLSLQLLWTAIYVVTASGAAYYQMK